MGKKNAQKEYADPPPPYSSSDFDGINRNSVPPQYPPDASRQPGSVQVNTVIHVSNPPVGPTPTIMVCPSCHETIQTRLSYEPGSKTHLACLLLCFLQCYICCLMPYCIPDCQNGVHSCPKCGAYVGTYNN